MNEKTAKAAWLKAVGKGVSGGAKAVGKAISKNKALTAGTVAAATGAGVVGSKKGKKQGKKDVVKAYKKWNPGNNRAVASAAYKAGLRRGYYEKTASAVAKAKWVKNLIKGTSAAAAVGAAYKGAKGAGKKKGIEGMTAKVRAYDKKENRLLAGRYYGAGVERGRKIRQRSLISK